MGPLGPVYSIYPSLKRLHGTASGYRTWTVAASPLKHAHRCGESLGGGGEYLLNVRRSPPSGPCVPRDTTNLKGGYHSEIVMHQYCYRLVQVIPFPLLYSTPLH